MPSSKPQPPERWPLAWRAALRNLAAQPSGWWLLAQAGTRQALETPHRRAQAMRESIFIFPGWEPEVRALARDFQLIFERRFYQGRWLLIAVAKPRRPSLTQILSAALQEPGSRG